DCSGEYLPHPIQKKSPTGASTEGSVSPSQYIRTMEYLQLPVGVIQMCCIEPGPSISAIVKTVCALMTTLGLIFHPFPRSRAACEPVPAVACAPPPFAPLKFSGLIERVRAFDSR